MSEVPIKNKKNIVKDSSSGAILNKSIVERDEYFRKKALFNSKRAVEENINNNDERINKLEDDMSEIKNLLRTLIDGNS